MKKFKIIVIKDKKTYSFEVSDYPQHDSERCKFEVYKDGSLVARLEPHSHKYLRIYKNTGNGDEELLYLIADKIESYCL